MTGKRPRDDGDDAASSSSSDSGDDMGPALPSAADATGAQAKKRRRTLPHERLYLAALPSSGRYSRSLMHKAPLAFAAFTPSTDFLITAGVDGQISFWKVVGGAGTAGQAAATAAAETKRDGVSVEFVKEFRAHEGDVVALAVSEDGRGCASAGADGTVKIWDVVSFDLIAVLRVPRRPTALCWVHGARAGGALLAVGNEIDGEIELWDGSGERSEAPVETVRGVHKRSVVAMAYSRRWECVISADEAGNVEYWSVVAEERGGKPKGVWEMKSQTSLFEFRKAKSVPTAITISPSGKHFATFSFPDRKVRVFDLATGRLFRSYDESIEAATEMQQAGTALFRLDDVEFGRRLAVERELEQPGLRRRVNVAWDETGSFVLYGSLLGTKVVNVLANRVVKVYGHEEPFRSLCLALWQGQPERKRVVTVAMAASENPLLQEAEARDAMLVSTAAGKVRFYMFTNDEAVDRGTRDVQNERPTLLNGAAKDAGAAAPAASGSAAVVHTTYGDIHVRLFPDAAPKAVENFVVHARNGYYNNVLFHRVIRKFMIQTGDPLGDGTGGESIWGREFEDEFSSLKHDRPYTLSMANAGPGTNGSQFFITTEKTPWLDGKHTIFGRAVQGLDVVHRIENARVYKEKPEEDIRIVNISVT